MKGRESQMKAVKTKMWFGALALSLIPAMPAAASGHEIGNGGGSWVCRETNGSIRWSKVVDLFEGENEFGLAISQYPGSVREIVDQVQLRIFRANRDLYETIAEYLDKVNYLEPSPPSIIYTEDTLRTIDDSLYRLEPSPKRCQGGEIKYGQTVNYKRDGNILVQSEIFSSLSNTGKASLVFHEAIYAYRRAMYGEKTSILTRRIVGLIFSTLSTGELKKALEELGEGEIPITGMSFSKIQPGSFMMGSPANEPDRYVGDETQYSMTIARPFEIMKTEVTQSQWFQIMGNNPSNFKDYENCPKTYVAPEKNKGVALCPNHPVESVSWHEVQEFLVKLNQMRRDGYAYRLPTEAEWEYAARAGTSTAYSFGSDPSQLFLYGWYSSTSANQTHEVSSLKPNNWGLFDMYGNVWEWVSDWYASDYEKYGNGGPSSGSNRVIRGGGWGSIARDLRSASRGSRTPSHRFHSLGFRLARSQ